MAWRWRGAGGGAAGNGCPTVGPGCRQLCLAGVAAAAWLQDREEEVVLIRSVFCCLGSSMFWTVKIDTYKIMRMTAV